MTPKLFCEEFNRLSKELNLSQLMEIKEEMQRTAVFSICNNIAGFFWLEESEITGMSITMTMGGNHMTTLLTLAVITDMLTGIPQEDRNFVFACLGLKNGTCIKGKQKTFNNYRFKVYKVKNLLMMDIYIVKKGV